MKYALFDLDGVVLFPRASYFSTRFAKEYGVDPALIMPFFKNDFYRCVRGELDTKEALEPYLSVWKWDKSVDELFSYWWAGEGAINEAVVRQIQSLREQGVRCYLAMDQEPYRAAYAIQAFGLTQKFDGIFSSYELHAVKSMPQYWQQVLTTLNNPNPNDVYFWDDEQENVDAAQAAGIVAPRFTDAFSIKIV